jgi:hypothetical protein
MRPWAWLLLGIVVGAIAFLIWWQRRAIKDAFTNKKEIQAAAQVAGGVQDAIGGLDSLWSSVKGRF